MSKGYDQFCPVAKASEVFASRWTPLILRELMAGMHAFNDIHRGVPLISRAVLVTRLRELEDQGVIERRQRAGSSDHDYWLTAAGESFRPAVSALGQWGLAHARERIRPSDLDPSVFMWALRRRVDRTLLPERRVVVQFEFSGVPANRTRFRTMWLVLERSAVDVCAKNPGHPVDLVFRGHMADFVAVYLGHAGLSDNEGKRLSTDGSPVLAKKVTGWLRLDKVVGRDFPIVPPSTA